ncbi:MAG: LacI family DNA-binding transcriptional regulator [Victivallales bacterium]|nr:LacI family DNA-binding transcriptional regulator [Victivallales bacterium]
MAFTMKDIAKIAGVSQQAVAAALSDRGTSKVSEKTRERVRAIAEKLHYVPNQNAKRLRGGSSNTIGIYGVPYVSVLEQSLFFELSVELSRYGYNLTVNYGMGEKASEQAIRNLLSHGVDGIIVTTMDNPMTQFEVDSVPYVFSPTAGKENYDVVVDHAAGTREAMKALVAKGRKSVVCLAPTFMGGYYEEANRQKYQGIVEGLKEIGATPTILTVEECGGEGAVVVEHLRQMAPDILFCINDYFAGRMLSLLLAAGIRVPDDIMVFGYDGLSICDLCAVPLSTVIQPQKKRAEIAVKLLLERIKEGNKTPAPAGIKLPSYFYPSASCGFTNEKIQQLPLYNTFSMLETNWENRL